MNRGPAVGALVGAAGGLLGAFAMVRLNHLLGPVEDDRGAHAQRRQVAAPNDTDGTISDEPGSMQAASAAAEHTLGRPLDKAEKQIAGPIVHYAFGAAAGAAYGAGAALDPRVTAAAGIPYGAAVWLTADEIALPLLGFARRPFKIPFARHAAALATHLVFGATVEAVRRALLGNPTHEDKGRRINYLSSAPTSPGRIGGASGRR